jgi:hypothetical protein
MVIIGGRATPQSILKQLRAQIAPGQPFDSHATQRKATMNSPRPRTTRDAALKAALRVMRDYLRDRKHHIPVCAWELKMARRIMNVMIDKYGWIARDWDKCLQEVGFDPETLEVIDEFRWSVALEMIHDPNLENTFPFKEFRKRLLLALEARENGLEAPSQDEPSSRSAVLERLGIELD